ncbi:ubiquitin-conjugating enzyme/RWD-like protein [Infundibulicybe gibba]|nr:ubiquitin-conjugating enzyme/RWD-like protein [Infundibulicybe gibba]
MPPHTFGQPQVSAITRTAISLEYASSKHHNHCPLGMYVVPSIESLLEWNAVFFVHQGYYADAILKFRITFPTNYPERAPTIHFITDIFHPLIGTDGLFSLSGRFRPWRPNEHHVFDILHYIKASFKKHALDKIQESDCLNKEAYRYHNSPTSFGALAAQSSQLSQSNSALFDQDHPSMATQIHSTIDFAEMTAEELDKVRAEIGLKWLPTNS